MYVPTVAAEGTHTLPTGHQVTFDDTKFHEILFGGDQLTVARARGAQVLRSTHDSAVSRITGLIPVIEDWHARMTMMKVCMYIVSQIALKIYLPGAMEKTLFQAVRKGQRYPFPTP